MPNCKACGYHNLAGAEQCEQCGARIIDEGTELIPPQPSTPTDQTSEEGNDLETRLVALLQKGKAISAVKLYQKERRVGSEEAQEVVETLAVQHGLRPKGSGCAGIVVLILTACGAMTTALG
jgi:hypothetical protein